MDASQNTGTQERLTRVFVSYAREDKQWLDRTYPYNLVPFLAESLRKQNVVFWFDKELVAGDKYRTLIEGQIDQAQIALLIVSQAFLNSEFIEAVEIPRIAERARLSQMIIVPVLVEPCEWRECPVLTDRQMVPGSMPLIDFTESAARWAKVKAEILDGLKTQVKRSQSTQTGPVEPPPAQIPPPQPPTTQPPVKDKARAEPLREPIEEPPDSAPPRKLPVWAWGALAAVTLLGVFAVGRWWVPKPVPGPAPQPQPASLPEPRPARTPALQPQPPSTPQPQPTPNPGPQSAPVLGPPKPVVHQQTYEPSDINYGGKARPQPQPAKSDFNAIYIEGKSFYDKSDYLEALPLLDQACSGGVATACLYQGLMYERTEMGVAQNYTTAFQLYSKACDEGEERGCFSIGRLYDGGKGVSPNHSTAITFYLKSVTLLSQSCDAGNADSCYELGIMYKWGRGVSHDFSKAVQFFSKGCDGNFGEACDELGIEYSNGDVPEDIVRSSQMDSKACNLNNAPGCFSLGFSYLDGNGVEKNEYTAKTLFQKGCSLGMQAACDELKKLQ